MLRKLVLLTTAGLAFLAALAFGALEVGDEAKGFGADAVFVVGDEVALKDLRGKVVLLQLAHTSSEPCKEQVAKLQKLAKDYGEAGLRVVVVFEEPKAAVAAWTKETGADFPVIAGVRDARGRWGLVKGYPSSYVLDINGKVVWAGNFADKGESDIAQQTKRVSDRPWLPDTCKVVTDLLDINKIGEAHAKIGELLGEPERSSTDRKRLEVVRDWIDAKGAKALETAVAAADKDDPYKAYRAYQDVLKSFLGTPAAETARASIEALLEDKEAGREIEAGKFFDDAFAEAKKLESTDLKKAIRALKKVTTKYRGTRAAADAQKWIEKLKAALDR